MKKIRLIIEIHQPMRLETYRFFEILDNRYYYDDYNIEYNINQVTEKYYHPANEILGDLIHFFKGNFKVSFLFSGVVLDQFKLYTPNVLESYKALADTGHVDLLSGTYSNSFGPFIHDTEHDYQVKLQNSGIKSVFGKNPVACPVRSPFFYHGGLSSPGISLLIENKLQNRSITYRIDEKSQGDWSKKPKKLIKLLNTYGREDYDLFTLFVPYDLFRDSRSMGGILSFLEWFPIEVLSKSDFSFNVPSESEEDSFSELNECNTEIRDQNLEMLYESLNPLQINALNKLYSFTEKIMKSNDPLLKKDWLYLQSCDHFYFMNPVLYQESEFSKIFLPYSSHYFAYMNYMNILTDFSNRLENEPHDDIPMEGHHDKNTFSLRKESTSRKTKAESKINYHE